jgi:hypothetical protein
MAWIDTVDEGGAAGALRAIYNEIAERRGKVANLLKAPSLNPQALEAHSDLYRTLLFGRSPLRRGPPGGPGRGRLCRQRVRPPTQCGVRNGKCGMERDS